jgi:hypothetical protein
MQQLIMPLVSTIIIFGGTYYTKKRISYKDEQFDDIELWENIDSAPILIMKTDGTYYYLYE